MDAGIKIKENESFENALRRFKKQVEKTGYCQRFEKGAYEKPSIKRKKKALAAKKRQ